MDISHEAKDTLLYLAIVIPFLLSCFASVVFFGYIFGKWCSIDWNCLEYFKKWRAGYRLKDTLREMILYKPKRKYISMNMRLLISLQISAMLALLSGFMVVLKPYLTPNSAFWCRVQSLMMQFFNWTTMIWILVIACWLFCCLVIPQVVVKRLHPASTILVEILFHLFVLVVSSLFTLLPATTESYGAAGLWCWILPTGFGATWQLAAYYIPLWIIIAVVTLIYGITIVHVFVNYCKTKRSLVHNVKRLPIILTTDGEEEDVELQYIRTEIKAYGKLIFTPLTYILIWIVPTINRFYLIITGEALFFLSVAHLFIPNCHSIFIVLIFFFDPIDNFKLLKRMLCCYYCKIGRKQDRLGSSILDTRDIGYQGPVVEKDKIAGVYA